MPESLSRSRLEAFSDGVIAVIITIMVLELKVPTVAQMADRSAVLANLRLLAVYLLSFIQVGIYWVNHHYLVDDLQTVSHGILWSNLSLLFTLSLIPFGIQWIGIRGISPVPVAVYSVCFFLPAVAWMVLSYVIRRHTHVPPAAGRTKQAVSSVFNLASIFVAFVSPWTALALIAVVAVLWLLPPRRIVEKTRALDSSREVDADPS